MKQERLERNLEPSLNELRIEMYLERKNYLLGQKLHKV